TAWHMAKTPDGETAGTPDREIAAQFAADAPVSPELLEVFQLEAAEHLNTICATLPLLEKQPDSKEYIQEVRRSAHTLKGAAAMVGFRSVTHLAPRMEDVLDLVYEGSLAPSPEILQLLFAATDALEDLASGKSLVLDDLYQRFEPFLAEQAQRAAAQAAPA